MNLKTTYKITGQATVHVTVNNMEISNGHLDAVKYLTKKRVMYQLAWHKLKKTHS